MNRHAALLLSIIMLAPAYGDEVIRETPSGGINWSAGVVFANGYGTAKDEFSAGQKRLMARRAAIVDAQRNLLEMVKGVRIDSVLTTDMAMQENREVVTRVEGIIKGAAVTRQNYQNNVFTVQMAMPIAGSFLQTVWPEPSKGDSTRVSHYDIVRPGQLLDLVLDVLVPSAYAAEAFIVESREQADAYRRLVDWLRRGNPAALADGAAVENALQQAIVDYETNSRYSGLLIDASAVPDFELATIPKIRDEEGNVLYPGKETSYSDIVNKRGVTYDLDLQDAIRNQRIANSPYIIKAVGIYESLASDLIIHNEDAARVLRSPSTVQAMNKVGVLIVVAM